MRLVVVTGVGTGVGKTHATVALLRAWGRESPVFGYKPIESGVTRAGGVANAEPFAGEDEARLAAASTFHVKQPPLQVRLEAPLSPHLAARREGVVVDVVDITRDVGRLRGLSDLVVELPGGLFSPLTASLCNADLVAALLPDVTLLVAPDRLGVLHDVRAVAEACRARGLRLSGVVLTAPAAADPSTGTNAAEIPLVTGLDVLASLPRAAEEALSESGGIAGLLGRCRGEAVAREAAPV